MAEEPLGGGRDDASGEGGDGHEGDHKEHHHDAWRPFIKPLILLTVSLLVGWAIVQFVGRIDWESVWAAFGKLLWWQFLPLIALLLLRQTLNAVPLTRFVPGLPLGRSIENDLTANLVGTFAPPPGDVVIRVSMFRSWNINPVDGMAGVTLNTLTFYSVRFLAPVVGILLLAVQGVERAQVITAVTAGLIAAAIMVLLWLITRGNRMGAILGRLAGNVAKRFRASVNPEDWSVKVADFSTRMTDTLKAGFAPSIAALLPMVIVDGLILLTALRFVGVGSDVLTAIDILGTFLIVYPLTLMPLAGLGLLDAALIAAWVEIAGLEWEASIVAALIIWRVTTIGGPLALGGGALMLWRRYDRRNAAAQIGT